jgi:uncharacterized protein YggE
MALLLLALLTVQQPAPPATPRPAELVTSGHGEVILPPDHAVLRLGVEARAGSAALASSQAGARVDRVRQAIRARGFALDSVRVVQFDVAPNYQFERERRLIDYAARATIQLTVRPLDRLGGVLDTALAAGAGDIQSIEFQSDSAPAARAQALARGLAQAHADATALARAAGGILGRLVSVSTTGPAMPMFRETAMQAVGGAPPLSGEVVVAVDVNATWEFVPAR